MRYSKLTLFAVLISMMSITACQKDEEVSSDDLIFGLSYGECTGDCSYLYLLHNGELFADDGVEHFIPDAIPFQSTAEPDSDYQLSKNLLDDFPEQLVSNGQSSYGCPDCLDQGTIYLELRRNGSVYKFELDPDGDSGDPAIDAYGSEVIRVVDLLRS